MNFVKEYAIIEKTVLYIIPALPDQKIKGVIFMKEKFGILPTGEETCLYTISRGGLTASVSDYGATLVNLLVPDKNGVLADVVLGYDDCNGYRTANGAFLGATVGRNANRVKGAAFVLGSKTWAMTPNEGSNNLHSGPHSYNLRMWKVLSHTEDSIKLELNSPHGDQGFPGNAVIHVTYSLDDDGGLHIVYDAVCDRDTVFNMTNHSYFNLAGQDKQEACLKQLLTMPARYFTPDDAESIPTGEVRSVAGTPMDFRSPKPIGRDIGEDYDALNLQGGYDHNWEVFCNPCATLQDVESGRTMAVYTDCPGIQFYAGNFLSEVGKGGIHYGKGGGVALETQFWPDSIHHPEWAQPITKAGEKYHSETVYRFSI